MPLPLGYKGLERIAGIKPAHPPWQGGALSLCNIRRGYKRWRLPVAHDVHAVFVSHATLPSFGCICNYNILSCVVYSLVPLTRLELVRLTTANFKSAVSAYSTIGAYLIV